MIDTHCHLTFPDFEGRVDLVLGEACDVGVTGAISVSTTPPDALAALTLAEEHANVWCTAGVHPLYADRGPHDWDLLRRVANHPKCVAWGELGLDNHYDRPEKAVQVAVLEEHLAYIEWCMPKSCAPAGRTAEGRPSVGTRDAGGVGVDKPVVVHCREAYEELISILRDSPVAPERFVFHCFTGGPEDVRRVLDFGAMVSFTGVVTFPNAPQVREAARLVPLERIMVETDAPFLTPAPHRKVRPNEPKYARVTAAFLAELRGESWDEFHGAINRNTERFFGIERVE